MTSAGPVRDIPTGRRRDREADQRDHTAARQVPERRAEQNGDEHDHAGSSLNASWRKNPVGVGRHPRGSELAGAVPATDPDDAADHQHGHDQQQRSRPARGPRRFVARQQHPATHWISTTASEEETNRAAQHDDAGFAEHRRSTHERHRAGSARRQPGSTRSVTGRSSCTGETYGVTTDASRSDTFETARLEFFSDGVFAIAITLLVIEIRPPENMHDLGQKLVDLWPSYVAYALSFLLIGLVWANHHVMFDRIARADRMLVFLNALLLLDVAFVPFPAAVLARAFADGESEAIAVLVYGVVLTLGGVAFNAVWRYAAHHRRLLDDRTSDEEAARISRRFVVGPFAYTLATIVGVFVPAAGLALFAALIVFYWLPHPDASHGSNSWLTSATSSASVGVPRFADEVSRVQPKEDARARSANSGATSRISSSVRGIELVVAVVTAGSGILSGHDRNLARRD